MIARYGLLQKCGNKNESWNSNWCIIGCRDDDIYTAVERSVFFT